METETVRVFVVLMLPAAHLGAAGHGARHLHLGVHEFGLRRHGRDFGADGVRARLLLPQLDQLLGQNLTRFLVAGFGHFLNFSFLQREGETVCLENADSRPQRVETTELCDVKTACK